MATLVSLALLGVPLLLGIMTPARYRLLVAVAGAVAATFAWLSGLSMHGNLATLLFFAAAPLSVGALSRGVVECMPVQFRRLSALLGAALLLWAIWFWPPLANDEVPFRTTFLLFSFVELVGLGLLASAALAELRSPMGFSEKPS